MSRRDQIADVLGVSVGDADTIRSQLNEFDAKDVAAVLATNLNGIPATDLNDLGDVDTSGGAEGDVLTQQNDGSFALEEPSGGSQPFRVEGPFTVGVADLNSTGDTKAVYTPTPGDILVGIAIDFPASTPWDVDDTSSLLEFGTNVDPVGDTGYMQYVDADLNADSNMGGPRAAPVTMPYIFPDATTFKVGFFLSGSTPTVGELIFSLLVMTP